MKLSFNRYVALFSCFLYGNSFRIGEVFTKSLSLATKTRHYSAIPSTDPPEPFLNIPKTISSMLNEATISVIEARRAGIPLACIDIPLPVTGGTEIDDWPGGIQQKYNTLFPMLCEMMKLLNFPESAVSKREYIGDCGAEDAVGYWQSNGIQLCCFPTADTISYLKKLQQWVDGSSTLVLVIPQFFLDPFSKEEAKQFVQSVETIYSMKSLLLKGPNALAVRGLLYRKYPGDFQLARRLDDGSYVVLKSMSTNPSQKELDDLFYKDSEVRDKSLSFFDRLKTQIPNFG